MGTASPRPNVCSRSKAVSAWHQLTDVDATDAERFAAQLDAVVRSHGYDTAFVGWERGTLALSAQRDTLSFPVGYGPHEGLLLAINKRHMVEIAARCGIEAPRTAAATAEELATLGGPVVVKPASQADAPISAIAFEDLSEALDHASAIRNAGGEPFAQEQLSGELMAVTLVAGPNGIVTIGQQVAEHVWPRPVGVTARGLTVRVDPELRAAIERLLEELSWQGIAQLQFVVPSDGRPRLIDFNPRLYGSIALAARAGANHADAWGRVTLGLPVERAEARPGVRYQWFSRDLRASLADDSPLREVARCATIGATAAHSLWDYSEPQLAPRFLVEQAGRALLRRLPSLGLPRRGGGREMRANARLHGLHGANASVRTRVVPSPPVRAAQRLAMRAGRLGYEQSWLARVQRARIEQLGAAAVGSPRLLVRVDEFPYYSGHDDPRYGFEASKRFHDVMAEEGVAHLMSVVPQWTHEPLNPDGQGGRALEDRDVELLERMRGDRVTFAQHGTTHRSRYADTRHHSELCGLEPNELATLLDAGRARLSEAGVHTRILVPPFNRFDASQWQTLESRYDVITGGPESVRLMGFHGGPLWRGEAVYLPCYAPLYDNASAILPAVESLIDAEIGTWIPIVLHLGWEIDDDYAALRRLARRIAPYAAHWDDFLRAVDASHGP